MASIWKMAAGLVSVVRLRTRNHERHCQPLLLCLAVPLMMTHRIGVLQRVTVPADVHATQLGWLPRSVTELHVDCLRTMSPLVLDSLPPLLRSLTVRGRVLQSPDSELPATLTHLRVRGRWLRMHRMAPLEAKGMAVKGEFGNSSSSLSLLLSSLATLDLDSPVVWRRAASTATNTDRAPSRSLLRTAEQAASA